MYINKSLIIVGLLSIVYSCAYAKNFPGGSGMSTDGMSGGGMSLDGMSGGMPGGMPGSNSSLNEENLAELKKSNPVLYGFEKRLLDIQQEVQEITQGYQSGNLSKADVRQRLTALFQEEITIKNNPEYLVEKKIASVLKGKSGAH